MGWFKKPFSESFGIAPGEITSPGFCRLICVLKAMVIMITATYVFVSCFIGVDAATVSDGDAPTVTEAPEESPEPTTSPVPEYVIENEVNLDGANLYSSSDSVTVYTQAVILASEEESEMDTSAFPEKSGYFVVPVSDTECVYVPEGYNSWVVYFKDDVYYSAVSSKDIYVHMDDSYQCPCRESGSVVYRYNADGTQNGLFSYSASNQCPNGRFYPLYWGTNCIGDIVAGSYLLCTSGEDSEEVLLESIALSSTSLSFVDLASKSLTATVTPEDFPGTLTWTSSDESVARYSGGLVIPVADGTCRIIASYVNPDGTVISASCDVTVTLPVVDEEPTELEAFLQEPIAVDRYQYEILKRMEFMQYAQALMIALIFILIFKRK